MNLDRMRRPPWWSAPVHLIGWFRRRKRDKARLAADLLRRKTPVTCAVVSVTYEGADGKAYTGAMWELMETPNGVRSTRYTDMSGKGYREEQWGAYRLIVEWRAHLLNHYRQDDGKFWFKYPSVKTDR